ncbi:hypothetical protein Asppvi_002015 [Aspergillus pseudoviridinutans]|uniref:Uncharacterized protein n=1 Tax=Aspergillus pseudoviridinutans TaxID=1517512 RepID=A0A9P3F0Q3_9EURO|nr:uncharacterized protein Asppvi_002015 [Aspergillus pseudoviridinutans]GIJ92737.1 hypothetical protein Asppvi_002015 [Aspergillus pseudoviridinutans]
MCCWLGKDILTVSCHTGSKEDHAAGAIDVDIARASTNCDIPAAVAVHAVSPLGGTLPSCRLLNAEEAWDELLDQLDERDNRDYHRLNVKSPGQEPLLNAEG